MKNGRSLARVTVPLVFGAAFVVLASPLFGGKDREPAAASGSLKRPPPPRTASKAAAGNTSAAARIGESPAGSTTDLELALTVRDAVLLALEHNGSLAVERIGGAIAETSVREERGAFDPTLEGGLGHSRRGGSQNSSISSARAGVSVPFPSGTEVSGEISAKAGERVSLEFSAGLSQQLLEGGKRAANLARIRQAEIALFSSRHELRGFSEALVASVEKAYWDELSAELKVEIYREGLRLAERQLQEIRERIDVGTIPAIELVAAQAEVALRREALLESENVREKARLKLLSLLNVPGERLYDLRLTTLDRPMKPEAGMDRLESHLASAFEERADLNQALLARDRGELEVVKTKNGLLPRLELFVSLGKTAYADSFSGPPASGGGDLSFDASLVFSHPIGNRRDRARGDRAVLTLRQAEASIENLKRLIELDVRSAHLDAARTRERIDTTAMSRSLQEEKLEAEMEKFRVGRSTALLVAQSQRDLLDSQIAEEEALIAHMKSLIDLYRLDGSLLKRRGIETPPERGSD